LEGALARILKAAGINQNIMDTMKKGKVDDVFAWAGDLFKYKPDKTSIDETYSFSGSAYVEGFAFYINDIAPEAALKKGPSRRIDCLSAAGLGGVLGALGGANVYDTIYDLQVGVGRNSVTLSIDPFNPANGAVLLPFLPIEWTLGKATINEGASKAAVIWDRLKTSYGLLAKKPGPNDKEVSNGLFRRIDVNFDGKGRGKLGIGMPRTQSIPSDQIGANLKLLGFG
jgi:hypothetical protein